MSVTILYIIVVYIHLIISYIYCECYDYIMYIFSLCNDFIILSFMHINAFLLGIMAISAPDGMLYDVHSDTTGRHNDKGYYRDSNVNGKLQQIQLGRPHQYKTYGDKGFDSNTHTEAAYHGPAVVTPAQSHANDLMKSARVAEEWDFGKVKSRCPLITHKRYMHIFNTPVLKILRVAVLLTNAHTCMKGSKTSEYFDCMPPDFETYFRI